MFKGRIFNFAFRKLGFNSIFNAYSNRIHRYLTGEVWGHTYLNYSGRCGSRILGKYHTWMRPYGQCQPSFQSNSNLILKVIKSYKDVLALTKQEFEVVIFPCILLESYMTNIYIQSSFKHYSQFDGWGSGGLYKDGIMELYLRFLFQLFCISANIYVATYKMYLVVSIQHLGHSLFTFWGQYLGQSLENI